MITLHPNDGCYPNENYPNENYPNENYPNENYPSENYPNENYPNENYPNENYPNENEEDQVYTMITLHRHSGLKSKKMKFMETSLFCANKITFILLCIQINEFKFIKIIFQNTFELI